MLKIILASALVATAAAAAAAEPTVYRLSPEEIAKIDPKPPAKDPSLAYDPLFDKSLFDSSAVTRDRRPHGEVGAFVGSGGARGVFGATTIPLGESGSASFMFENSQSPRYKYRRR